MAAAPSDSVNGWHLETLPGETRAALETLAKEAWLADSPWYLAGGTALALTAGHRASVDLDFFTPEKSFSAAAMTGHLSMPEGAKNGRAHRSTPGTVQSPHP